MFASIVDDVVAYGRKQDKAEVLIIILIKEAWELLLSSANQVASNLFNGSYEGKYFIKLCCIIDEGNLGKNSLSQIYFINHITVLFECINGNNIPLGVIKVGGL